MINIKTLVKELNSLKNRAIKIADRAAKAAIAESQSSSSHVYVPEDAEEFGFWGCAKFFFNGSKRVTQLMESIDFVFDMIEEDLDEVEKAQRARVDFESAVEVEFRGVEEPVEEDFLTLNQDLPGIDPKTFRQTEVG